MLEVGNAHKEDTEYFEAIDEQMQNGGLAAMLCELLSWPITLDMRKVPVTPWLVEQRIASADPKRLWLRDLIAEGGFPRPAWDDWFELNVNDSTAVPRKELFASAKDAFSRAGRPASERQVSDWLKKELGELFNVDGKRETVVRKGKKERPRTWGFAPLKELEKYWLDKYGEDLSRNEPAPLKSGLETWLVAD